MEKRRKNPAGKPCNPCVRPPATIPIFTFDPKNYHNEMIDFEKGDSEYDFCGKAEKGEERERLVTGGTG
jgi:hypothetical protein